MKNKMCNEIEFLVGTSYPWRQCAAERMNLVEIIAHPQLWRPFRWIEHWYSAKPSSASVPPTMRGDNGGYPTKCEKIRPNAIRNAFKWKLKSQTNRNYYFIEQNLRLYVGMLPPVIESKAQQNITTDHFISYVFWCQQILSIEQNSDCYGSLSRRTIYNQNVDLEKKWTQERYHLFIRLIKIPRVRTTCVQSKN